MEPVYQLSFADSICPTGELAGATSRCRCGQAICQGGQTFGYIYALIPGSPDSRLLLYLYLDGPITG